MIPFSNIIIYLSLFMASSNAVPSSVACSSVCRRVCSGPKSTSAWTVSKKSLDGPWMSFAWCRLRILRFDVFWNYSTRERQWATYATLLVLACFIGSSHHQTSHYFTKSFARRCIRSHPLPQHKRPQVPRSCHKSEIGIVVCSCL